MIFSAKQFLQASRKAVTLMGMSGVGKSYAAVKMEAWGWFNYSCDHLIGAAHLKKHLDGAGQGESADNIAALSDFVGKIGDPAKGGLNLDEFRHRQNMYYRAECDVLRAMPAALEAAQQNFVNDSSGSLCEIEDESIICDVAAQTLFVYLKVPEEDHAEILKRATSCPKPLYFPTDFLDAHLEEYRELSSLNTIEEIDPTAFLRWVFPRLFQSRLPKYQRLADTYGVTISSHKMGAVNSEEEFFNIIAEALDE